MWHHGSCKTVEVGSLIELLLVLQLLLGADV